MAKLTAAPVCAECLAAVQGWTQRPRCAQCGRSFPRTEALQEGRTCAECLRDPSPYERIDSAGPYQGVLRRLVLLLKYDRMEPLAGPLAARMAESVQAAVASGEPRPDRIVPVPLHWRRKRRRGFNQAEALAAELSRRLGVAAEATALRRKRATPPQTGGSREARMRNLRGAFEVKKPETVRDRTVLLVDDVMTTGATARACARALIRAGARRVSVATAARADWEGEMS